MSGFKSQSYSEILGTFLFWYFERVSFCSPGWPGIGDPPDCWDYRCVTPPSCSEVIRMSGCLETRSESEPAMPLCLVSHLDCFQFQSVVRPAAQP